MPICDSSFQFPRRAWVCALVMALLCQCANASVEKRVYAMRQLDRVGQALDTFHHDTGRWPSSGEGLEALTRPQPGSGKTYLRPSELRDPWGKPLAYRQPGAHRPHAFALWSYGKNGVDDDGAADDLSNWAGYDRREYPGSVDWTLLAGCAVFLMCFGLPAWIALKRSRRP